MKDIISDSGDVRGVLGGNSRKLMFSDFKDNFDMISSFIDDFFGDDLSRFQKRNRVLGWHSGFPKVDVEDLGDAYKIDAVVAGFGKEDIEVEIKNNSFVLRLNKVSEQGKTGESKNSGKYIIKEISRRSSHRIVPFPEEITTEGITHSLDGGVLSCVIKKKKAVKEDDSYKIVLE